jgi:hypothetical protein
VRFDHVRVAALCGPNSDVKLGPNWANCRLMHCSKRSFEDRDPGYVTPPAQIRACGSPAHCSTPRAPSGSTLGGASRRIDDDGGTDERVAGRSHAAVFGRVAVGKRARRIADPLRVACGERRLGGGDDL